MAEASVHDRPKQSLLRAVLGWTLFLTIETTTQVVLKMAGAGLNLDRGFWPMALTALHSPYVIGGFVLYFAGFLVWMTILRDGDLGRAYPMTSLIYATTLIAAVALFHEMLSPVRIAGVATIMAGVVMISRDESSAGRDEAAGLALAAEAKGASNGRD